MLKCKFCGGQVLPGWDGVAECLQCGREPVYLAPPDVKALRRGPREKRGRSRPRKAVAA